jgi:ATP-dependent DNA helicase PIF1
LVIDEISMVENLALEPMNKVMKSARENHSKPFGGVQIVVTGDVSRYFLVMDKAKPVQFYQLAPVKPFEYCVECGWELKADRDFKASEFKCENEECSKDVYYDRDKWAFNSAAWQVRRNCTVVRKYRLTEIGVQL